MRSIGSLTHKTLWKGSSPRMTYVLIMRNKKMTSVNVNVGATSQIKNTGPRPDRKGGALRDWPPSMSATPGNTNAAPMVLATAHRAYVMISKDAVLRLLHKHGTECSTKNTTVQCTSAQGHFGCSRAQYLIQDKQVLTPASIWLDIAR